MNRQEFIDILSVLAVVASLVFVGYEIRQNTIAARASAYQAIGIATASIFDSIAHDPQYLETRSKPPNELSFQEWTQLVSKMTVFARIGETVLIQVEQGLLPPDAMERLGYRGWKSISGNLWLTCAWPIIRSGVSDEFRAYVEGSEDLILVDCSEFPRSPNL